MIVVSDTSPVTSSVRQLIFELETTAGFHLSKQIKEIVLQKAGES